MASVEPAMACVVSICVFREIPSVLGVVGIVLATGLSMVARNCLPSGGIDLRAVLVSAGLVVILAAYRHLRKKKLSPITLICVSAVLGIIVYGI